MCSLQQIAYCGASIWMRARDDQDGKSVTVAS
jgi:hypothetical protein